jgi:hypothetical protein
LPARPSLGPPRGLTRQASSFSRLINNFVGPEKPTSVTGGDTLFGSGIAAPKRPHVIEEEDKEALALIDELMRHATQRKYEYRTSGVTATG